MKVDILLEKEICVIKGKRIKPKNKVCDVHVYVSYW